MYTNPMHVDIEKPPQKNPMLAVIIVAMLEYLQEESEKPTERDANLLADRTSMNSMQLRLSTYERSDREI